MSESILSIMVLAAFALVAGAVYLLRSGRPRKQPVLMLVLAVVMLVNAAILAIPNGRGVAPAAGVVPK